LAHLPPKKYNFLSLFDGREPKTVRKPDNSCLRSRMKKNSENKQDEPDPLQIERAAEKTGVFLL
jgi:hypothetical protein